MEESNKHRSEGKVKKNEDQSESQEEQGQGGQHYESSFVVSEDEEDDGYYGPMAYRDSEDDSDDHKLSKKDKKKRKKKSKKHKKEKKAKRMKELDEDDFDQDDLEVIDNQNKLTRLKKKVKPHESEEQHDNYQDDDADEDDFVSQGQEVEEYYDNRQESEDDLSSMNQIFDKPFDVFDPNDMKQLKPAEEAQIMETDLPQRYINLCKNNFRGGIRKINQVKDIFEKEDLSYEANWIFQKMKTQGCFENYYAEHHCVDRIKKVLEFIHRDHLQIMYIYYYRKNVYSDFLNLEHLWKIQEFDQEWHSFREKQKKFKQLIDGFLSSYTEIPGEVKDMLLNLHDYRSLKYFEDYERFMVAKYASIDSGQEKLGEKSMLFNRRQRQKNKAKGHLRQQFLEQMVAKGGVIQALEMSKICLTPQMLCYNMSKKAQQKKPFSPINQPKDEFQRIIGSDNPQTDKARFPLLVGQNRFKTITRYLSYELFTYPELRKILKEKYLKRLVISTAPTDSGGKDIDLYHPYFPIKRLKDKPIHTLKRELWILARKAESQGLIKLDLKFQWEITATERIVTERDQVYMEIIKNYYDLNTTKSSQIWNLFRKRVISALLNEYFLPSFMKEVKDQLSQQGQKQIISACCAKLRQQLNKGPSMKQGKPIKILALVLEDTKLGVAFVDDTGKAIHSFQTIIANDQMLKDFVSSQNLKFNIKEYKPDMILISANCKKAQTLRKELRTPDLFPETIFCAFGQYEVPRLAAKKKIISGLGEEQAILEAVSMARLKQNPMAEIIALWHTEQHKNGILSMNLHPYQKYVNQKFLVQALERVVIQIVNLVGLNINDIKKNDHLQGQLRFVCGLGDIRSKNLLQNLKHHPIDILNRKELIEYLKGDTVCKNCFPFLKIQSSYHKLLFQKFQKEKKSHAILQFQKINLLEMTRIPEQWHKIIFKKLNDTYKSTLIADMRSRKTFAKLSDDNIFLLEIFKNSQKAKSIQWRIKDHPYFDEELVKSELLSRFKNTRDPERVMENRQIFYSLLKESPDTLKRYSLLSVKVLSIKKNYLNVIIPQNGLFGYIRLQSNKSPEELQQIYEKGQYIKAILIGFPFDQKSFREQQPTEQQQLLKVEMALDFPHKDNVDRHQNMRHDCMTSCFPTIVKTIHPLIDLEKDRFELRKQDKPIMENKQEKEKERYVIKNLKPDFRRISHPKFKNIDARQAIQLLKNEPVGDFVIRPSSQGPEYLTITWKFFGKVIHHIKIRCEHKGMNTMSMTYRIEDRDNRSYNSLEEIVEKFIKPMNVLVQDVVSNRKFLDRTVEEIENTIKKEMSSDSSHIYYFFGVSQQYPQFFLLIYMYREKKPIREFIKVKSSGLYFHEQQFANIRDLTTWFKEHLKEKEYQRYVKSINAQMMKPR